MLSIFSLGWFVFVMFFIKIIVVIMLMSVIGNIIKNKMCYE